jgi:hypothetical protein
MSLKNFQLPIITVVLTILFSSIVLAIPGVPHQFYGTVTLNGNSAPDGTAVVVEIEGEEVASTTTKDGKYGYDPIFYVEDPNNDLCYPTCPTLSFFVNGIDTGQTKSFCNTCVTELNLIATGGEVPPSPPGGGGGGGGLPPTPEEEEEEEGEEAPPELCEERWSCSKWSKCVEGVQTRECEDLNKCGTEKDKPLESQPCSAEEAQEGVGGLGALTGMFAAIIQNPLYLLSIIVIIIAIVLFVFRKKILLLRKK